MTKKKINVRLIVGISLFLVLIAFCWYSFDDLKEIIKIIYKGDVSNLQTYLKGIKVESIAIIMLMQILQLIFVVFPAEIIEVAASLSFGWLFGTIICMAGVLVGSSLIFLLVKVFKISPKNKIKNRQISQISSEKSNKGLFMLILALYLSPIIPYGAISYFFASKKVPYWKYILITMIGALPSVLFATTTANIVLNLIMVDNFVWLGIFILGIILFLLAYSYFSTNRHPLHSISARKPNFFLYYFFKPFLYVYFKIKNNLHIDSKNIRSLKGPYIILGTHPSRPDFLYAACVTKRRVNVVSNRYYFYNPKVRYLMEKLGCIPKDLFNHDPQTIRMVMQSIKNGGIVMIMPEGRLSASGVTEKITEGTAKLIKKLNVPVVSVNIQGAYFTGAKWMKKRRKGRIDVKADILFNKDELLDMDIDAINRRIAEALVYDDAKYVEKRNITYSGKAFADNLDSILFLCPECGKEFTLRSEKNTISCQHCGISVNLNNKYQFIDKEEKLYKYASIKEWYRFQIETIKTQMINDINYQLVDKVKLKMPTGKKNKIRVVGEGTCTLDATGLCYDGTFNGEKTILKFDVATIPAIPFGAKENFEVYRNGTYYLFVPENVYVPVKWSIAGELNYEIHGGLKNE